MVRRRSAGAAAVLILSATGACADPRLLVVPPSQEPRTVQPIAPPRATAPSSEVERRLLDAHNAERGRVGAPPLRWADALEAEARAWARQLIAIDRFAHDPAPHGHGENLWTGWGGRVWTPEAMVGEWIAEKADYRHGVFPNVSRTGNWSDVSHYTQLVWRDTTHVGCAVESRGDRSVLACRYAPPGNIDGRTAY
ncbi:CAP domain-containing protein [uncultured Brevundimonas sp.]|uniref:CAP domain-containing protein n=1 Tax=uncultured Brevundimonas sp. TaxID=213418 RepID=UPI0026222725|nr:CAP domain-containing protein [uncultured Brevundimonas sp.]